MSRLVFCDTERRVPALSRGWRTPDPSPTRNAMDLPGCGPRMCQLEAEEQENHGASTPRRRTAGGGRAAAAAEDKETRRTSRTPSPEPILRAPPMALEAKAWPLGMDCLEAACGDFVQSMWSIETQAPELTREPSPRSASSSVSTVAEGEDEFGVPPPPQPAGYVVVPVITPLFQTMPAVEFAPGLWAVPDDGYEGCMEMEMTGLDLCEAYSSSAQPCLSRGSVGHPFTCAEFCKYAKKARGCKDGADCDRCHLCTTKTQKQPMQPPSRSSRSRRGHRG